MLCVVRQRSLRRADPMSRAVLPSVMCVIEVSSVNRKYVGRRVFDVLLTVHLSIILAFDQLNAQILFFISLLYSSTCFEHCCAHRQEVKLYYTAYGIVTLCRWPSRAHLRAGRPPTVVMIPDAI